jgi:hypothetical protein
MPLGIKVRHEPIRGGTDGATFSFLGCPTPNLGTGSYNHHGRFRISLGKRFQRDDQALVSSSITIAIAGQSKPKKIKNAFLVAVKCDAVRACRF